MDRNCFLPVLLSTLLVPSVALSQAFSSSDESHSEAFAQEISVATQNILREFVSSAPPDYEPSEGELESEFFSIPPMKSGEQVFWQNTTGDGQVPTVSMNSLIISLAPNTTEEGLNELANTYSDIGWTIIDAYPESGQVVVNADLTSFYAPSLERLDPTIAALQGAIDASKFFEENELIIEASPDSILMSQQQPFAPIPKAQSIQELNAETIDWGIEDIQANQLWSKDGADAGVIFGVIDVGFASHEDLIFTPTSRLSNVHDHGNHVAGIACAGHNGLGVTGVLPNCFVQAASGNFYPIENDVDNVSIFLTRFSQIIRSIQDFSSIEDAAIVYNLSLGYNWMPNFGINVDEDDAAIYRNFVQMQGESFLRTLARLEREGALVFSAAGNDSSRLSSPMSARYASPFNWAAITASARGDSRAGIIVEAHDRNGETAVFSNTGGHISCPGVDVLAPVASKDDAYGLMSGTSMASPYCASGFQLLMLTSPTRTSREALDCFLDAAEPVSSGAPRLRLEAAHQLCR